MAKLNNQGKKKTIVTQSGVTQKLRDLGSAETCMWEPWPKETASIATFDGHFQQMILSLSPIEYNLLDT